MSYILEALKKSEQERELGKVPGLITAQEQILVSRPRWVLPVLAILLVNGILLTWFVLQKQGQGISSNMPVENERSVQMLTPPTKPVPLVAEEYPEPVPASQPGITADLVELENSDPSLSPTPTVAQVLQTELERQAVEPRVEESPEIVRRGSVVFADRPLDAFNVDSKGDGTELPVQHSDTEVEENIPLWRDLPSSVRSSIPRIKMDVHVYAEEPENRFVLVRLRRYREGDTLEDGPEVESITPDGMVLYFQGDRFKITKQ